jgi:hypothetical protein
LNTKYFVSFSIFCFSKNLDTCFSTKYKVIKTVLECL